MSKLINLTGRKFPHFQVIERCGTYIAKYHKEPLWLCRCECGKYFEARTTVIRSGRQKSCGCYRARLASERARAGIWSGGRWKKRENA